MSAARRLAPLSRRLPSAGLPRPALLGPKVAPFGAFKRMVSSTAAPKAALHKEAALLALGAGAAALALARRGGRRPAACEGDDRSHELSAEEQRTIALFEKASGSVVHINTFTHGAIMQHPFGGIVLGQEMPQGTGSGFVWDRQHIVTNFHVVKDADRATVVMADGSSCEASLVGAEPDCDLAVLKVKGKEMEPLQRGRSDNLKVGQKVFAIGNPFGLDQTLTNGIVSGLGREMPSVSGRTMRGLVQTDAAINPGNSGGPLLDARGRLIGVNTMIASPSGAFAGVGFAIPVDTVNRVVQQLVTYGHTRVAYLGVVLCPDHIKAQLSRELRRLNRTGIEGALVMHVEPGSPADDADLQQTIRTREGLVLGDEIISVGGKTVTSAEQFRDLVESQRVGEKVELEYRRRSPKNNEVAGTAKVSVILKERPSRAHNLARGALVNSLGEDERPRSRL